MDTQSVLAEKFEMPSMAEASTSSRERCAEEDARLRGFLCGFLAALGTGAQGLDAVRALEAQLEHRLVELTVRDAELLVESVMRVMARLRVSTSAGVVLLRSSVPALSLPVSEVEGHAMLPVKLRTLEMLMRNLDRRLGKTSAREQCSETLDVWVYDAARWKLVAPRGASVQLSLAESQVVRCLFSRRNQVVSRDEMLSVLNRPNLEAYSRNLDVTVSRLRRKVDEHCREKLPIISARGQGYVFSAPAMILG